MFYVPLPLVGNYIIRDNVKQTSRIEYFVWCSLVKFYIMATLVKFYTMTTTPGHFTIPPTAAFYNYIDGDQMQLHCINLKPYFHKINRIRYNCIV